MTAVIVEAEKTASVVAETEEVAAAAAQGDLEATIAEAEKWQQQQHRETWRQQLG